MTKIRDGKLVDGTGKIVVGSGGLMRGHDEALSLERIQIFSNVLLVGFVVFMQAPHKWRCMERGNAQTELQKNSRASLLISGSGSVSTLTLEQP
jgi:hypothetical protein